MFLGEVGFFWFGVEGSRGKRAGSCWLSLLGYARGVGGGDVAMMGCGFGSLGEDGEISVRSRGVGDQVQGTPGWLR